MATTSTFLLLLLALVAFTSAGRPVVTEALIERINSEQSTWEAAANGFLGMNKEEVSMFLGAKLGDRSLPLKELVVEIADEDIPASFDASQKWPHCPSITHIRDQSACGSCWAVSFAEVASDRSCIALNINVTLSAADMAFCCSSCGDGCNGGYPSAAWEYYSSTGVVTTKCDPYPFPSCMHHVPPGPGTPPACPSQEYPNQPCPTGCKTGLSWSNDLHYGASAYGVTGVAEIQKEIMTNGPVQGTFMVYSDFPTYKSGVYQRSRSASPIGGHAIKIVGWGEENGIPYWKIANSWNKYWGQDGYVLFLRGQDECGIEDGVVAGIPKN